MKIPEEPAPESMSLPYQCTTGRDCAGWPFSPASSCQLGSKVCLDMPSQREGTPHKQSLPPLPGLGLTLIVRKVSFITFHICPITLLAWIPGPPVGVITETTKVSGCHYHALCTASLATSPRAGTITAASCEHKNLKCRATSDPSPGSEHSDGSPELSMFLLLQCLEFNDTLVLATPSVVQGAAAAASPRSLSGHRIWGLIPRPAGSESAF